MPVDALVALLRTALGDRLRPEAATFVDMFDDSGILESPFAPGGVRTFVGKKEIASYLDAIGDVQGPVELTLLDSYDVVDEDVTILEYGGTVQNRREGTVYAQRYVAVVTLRNGCIALFREYWDPMPVIGSFRWNDDSIRRPSP